jgi:hypothetical protein
MHTAVKNPPPWHFAGKSQGEHRCHCRQITGLKTPEMRETRIQKGYCPSRLEGTAQAEKLQADTGTDISPVAGTLDALRRYQRFKHGNYA